MVDKSIHIKGNVTGSNLVTGSHVSFHSQSTTNELEKLVKLLVDSVDEVQVNLDREKAKSLQEDLDIFTGEILKPQPSYKWLKVSAKSLTDTAKSIGKIGKPILEYVLLISKLLNLN